MYEKLVTIKMIGTYQNVRNQLTCKTCQAGLYQTEIGQHFCQSCGTGQYIDDTATIATSHDEATDCKTCTIGKYIDDVGGNHGMYVLVNSNKCTGGSGNIKLIDLSTGQPAAANFDGASETPPSKAVDGDVRALIGGRSLNGVVWSHRA